MDTFILFNQLLKAFLGILTISGLTWIGAHFLTVYFTDDCKTVFHQTMRMFSFGIVCAMQVISINYFLF